MSFNGAGMFRAFNPVMLRGFGIYLLAMNCVTLLVFVADKRIALANGDTPRSRGRGAGSDRSGGGARSRVPESWLMGLSFMGGALGGIIAMRLFNHKTRDWYFVLGGCPCSLYCRLCCSYIFMRAGCSRLCRFA